MALLELYTSEGCSSCPPAESWMARLTEHPGLWRDFVPIAWHVDYWDHLGWKDPFAHAAYSERQQQYATSWGSDSLYTPAFVLDGREWRGWMKRDPGLHSARTLGGTLSANSSDGREWHVAFRPDGAPGADCEFHAALLGCGLLSKVKAGENRGRQLTHDFVALTLLHAPAIHRGDDLQATFRISPSPAPALRLAIAVWVTRPGSQASLQATGGWLAENQK